MISLDSSLEYVIESRNIFKCYRNDIIFLYNKKKTKYVMRIIIKYKNYALLVIDALFSRTRIKQEKN